jgi:RNA polymerase sigma-70 factor (ECF subfamily)
MKDPGSQPGGDLVELPGGGPAAVEVALNELEHVYAFIYVRVGNRPDAEDLTQQVALRAIPRLRAGASPASIRAYLYAAARTVLANFWSARLGVPEDELHEELALRTATEAPASDAPERVSRILQALPPNYRTVLDLRFLRGYSLKEVAKELGTTVGNVKIMQLRALRAAAKVGWDV